MLLVENLTLTHLKDLTPLIENLTFSLKDGERMALIGEEGNGKSTLLRILAGDESVKTYVDIRGKITLTSRAAYLPQELASHDREKSAYAFFSDCPAFFDQSARDLGELAARLRLPSDVFYSEQALASFSGGERVKLQMARLLMQSPQLLLLDEPSNDLDRETVQWLESFLNTCGLSVLFVSHDEALLEQTATAVLLIERLRRRQVPRAGVSRMGYREFTASRSSLFSKQEQVARKEREEFKEKMQRFEQIRRRVEHDQEAISRRNPGDGRLLKKKMHAVLSMGRRFEREALEMTAMPESEEAIFAKLTCTPLPPAKTVLSLDIPQLCVGERVLCRNVRLNVRANEKLCILGKNGVGKSTLLRAIRDKLHAREDLRVFYMPQDPGDLLDMEKTPIDMLTSTGDAQERAHIGVMLGSMKFTAEEMHHPCAGLSGGQKAKLMFLAMALSGANVLLLDEPTRNLSPLSGPVIRRLFADYPGCILAVSHDRLFAGEVCTRAVLLTPDGFQEARAAVEDDRD